MKRKLLSAVIITSMCMTALPMSYAEEIDRYDNSILLMVNSNTCFVNGEEKTVGDAVPTIVEDRTLVPARFLSESLGGSASWDDASKTAILSVDGTEIKVPIGEDYITVDGKKKDLDVGGTLINDRTMLPLRGICEALGKTVEYNNGRILIGTEEHMITDDTPSELLRKNILNYKLYKGKSTPSDTVKAISIEELAKKSECYIVDSIMMPYETEKGECYLSRAKMNIVNMKADKKDFNTYTLDFDVYNQRQSYGIIEVYNEKGEFLKSEYITPYGGSMTTSLFEWWDQAKRDVPASTKLLIEYFSGNKDYIDYVSESEITHVNIEVPRNGYMLFTANSADSVRVERKNIAHAVSEIIIAAYSTAGAFKNVKSPATDSLKDAFKGELEKLFVQNNELYMEVCDIIYNTITSENIDDKDAKKSMANIAKTIYEKLDLSSININSLWQTFIINLSDDSVKDLAKELQKNIPVIGDAFSLMDAMADTFNFATFVMDFDHSRNTPSTVFIFKESIDFFYYDEKRENIDKWTGIGEGELNWNKFETEYNMDTKSKTEIARQPGKLGNFSHDIDGDGTEEAIEIWRESGKAIRGNGYAALFIYVNGALAIELGYGSSEMPDVMALGVGDIYKDDGCRELYAVIDTGEPHMQTAVIRYDGNGTAKLDFYDDYYKERPNPYYADWSYYYKANPMTKLALGVDGKGTFTIKYVDNKNTTKINTDKYTETEHYSRIMVKN